MYSYIQLCLLIFTQQRYASKFSEEDPPNIPRFGANLHLQDRRVTTSIILHVSRLSVLEKFQNILKNEQKMKYILCAMNLLIWQ